ncbi:DUF465 domain-containing protein [Pseudomonas sp. PS02288]|uniref:YdcH family protein n=1 Tax=Pseudomonas sp. PS02288 TaxID=2991443 RepID=UPI00249CEDA5|nr:DUF465 domain-containing protein [Pseudomonas sp. PS02288]
MHIEYYSQPSEFDRQRSDSLKLRKANPRFARLADQFDDVDKRILRVESGVEKLDDTQLSALRMQRVGLQKDLSSQLRKAAGECCNCGKACSA